MKEQLLCYLSGPMAWSTALEGLCHREKVRMIPVTAAQCQKTVGALLGLPVNAKPSSVLPPPKEPVLVLCGFTPERMDIFLARLRESGIPPVLKAVVTPTNLGWTFSALAIELAQERAEMGG